MFFVYILKCADGTFYCGKTTDIARRLRQHNGEIKGGAKYTLVRRPVKVVYIEELDNLGNALKREFQIKKLKREEKQALFYKKE